MSKFYFCLLPLPFLLFAPLLFAQAPCDTSKVTAILAQANTTLLGKDFLIAPDIALSALPFLEKCPERAAALYEQAAIWQTSFEQFEAANVHLEKAKMLLAGNDHRIAEIKLLQARLGLASKNFERIKAALDEIFGTQKRLSHSTYAKAWMLKAKWCYVQTKPEQGMACLDSAATYINFEPTLQLQAEAWGTRVDLDFISGDFKHAIHLADSALMVLKDENSAFISELKYRLLETSGRLARLVNGIEDGHKRLVLAQNFAASQPPYLRTRLLPSALSQLIYSTFEQEGEKAAQAIFSRLELLIQPERSSHQAAMAEALNNQARLFNTLGQFEQAIASAEQSIAILKVLPGDNSQRLSANYIYLASSYRLLNDLESSITAGETALALRKKLQPGYIGLGTIYNELLQTYSEAKDTARTKAVLLEFEALIESQKDQSNLEPFTYSLAYNWLHYWRIMGQPLKGIAQAESFLKTSGPRARMRGIITTDLEYRICDAYQEAGQYRAAFERIEPIVLRLKKRYQESGTIFYEHYSWVLAQSAYIALDVFEHLGDTAMLSVAETRCKEAEDLLFALRQRDPREGARNFVTDEFLYLSLMRVRAALFQRSGNPMHVERAFAVSESFQLVDMQRLLSENQALHFGGVSQEAAKEERALLENLTELKSKKSGLRFQAPGPETDALAANLETQLSAASQQYNGLLNNLEKQFPEYYQLKYNLPVISLAATQKELLAADQCLLKIYPFNDTAICLLVRPDTALILMTSFGGNTQTDLTVFLNGLREFPAHANLPESLFAQKQKLLADASARVYQNLFAPLAPWFTREIIVAASGIFNVVPFDALLTAPVSQITRPASWEYWGKTKTISYTASATIFQFVQQRRPFRTDLQNVLVMAPHFSGDLKAVASNDFASRIRADFFTPLPHTGEEALAVAQMMDGKAFSGTACSVGDFLKNAAQNKVLHLATHASAGGHGLPAFISFQPEGEDWRSAMLFESDIYSLRLSADLVTLSACETALGKKRYGDGLHGIARAFTCAGARNIVASLWSVNDASTKNLMILFYQEFKKGVPYNQALANAKRIFMHENRSYAHPYYWAGFVLNGR